MEVVLGEDNSSMDLTVVMPSSSASFCMTDARMSRILVSESIGLCLQDVQE